MITVKSTPCDYTSTKTEKSWKYEEYYIGEKDRQERRSGRGVNYWSGAKSLENYNGNLFMDTMHGLGEYRWRYLGQDEVHITYEGFFYCNRMHGHGTMSYPDGKVFAGVYHNNVRWGPGVESQACLKEDVGLWRGMQLVRLAWRPPSPSVAPDFNTTIIGKAMVDSHRILLTKKYKSIGETNSAIDLLKQYGTDPMVATKVWHKLYPKNCTDTASLLCHVEAFDREYYKDKVNMLEEVSFVSDCEDGSENSQYSAETPELKTYYAWNNNKTIVHMMKHCYTHNMQRSASKISIDHILSGRRQYFKPPGKNEADCRTLLMACFIGNVTTVTQLINVSGVHPDVADSAGNSAIMYAACGDNAEVIHFLKGAGANVNSYNDSCCTPLGVALLHLACAQKNITPNGMVQASLAPPVVPAPIIQKPEILEWNVNRDVVLNAAPLIRSPSKLKAVSANKIKSLNSVNNLGAGRKKTDALQKDFPQPEGNMSHNEDNLYSDTIKEYLHVVNSLYFLPSAVNPIPYIFEVRDMVNDINGAVDDVKKVPEKGGPKKNSSKVLKETMKTSKVILPNVEKDGESIDSAEKLKLETLGKIMLTILQLLADGADPKLVRCPKPALFMAIMGGYPNLVKHLINYGADIDEVHTETYSYTPLDLAISQSFTYDTLDMVKSILECGARPNRRLHYVRDVSSYSIPPPLGPTLLHAVLARKTEVDTEEEVQLSLLKLLLKYNFDPVAQYNGQSAIDIAMTKNMRIFDVFIRCPKTNLNAIINIEQQTILVKMFTLSFFRTQISSERLSTLTNLLLFGADPLLECRNEEEIFSNLFVYTKAILKNLENTNKPPSISTSSKPDPKKSEKPAAKVATDDVGDYKQAVDLVTECARLLHVRWIQAKLMKELVEIIDKYKHRQWNMIIREHKNKKNCRLWLTTQRCLEIWDIMKGTKNKVYRDDRVLKHLLYIIMFYTSKTKILASTKVLTEEKCSVEYSVARLLQDRQMADHLRSNVTLKMGYVTPELTPKKEEYKFNVCFECYLPFEEEKIECLSCKLVFFCSFECMKINVERTNCHPCSEYLKMKFFPSESFNTEET